MRIALALVVAAIPSFALAQQPAPPPRPTPPRCDSAEHRAFDFWKGRWRVESGGQLAGHSEVSLVAGDCVLLEQWTGAAGGRGASLNAYDPSDKRWKQSWVWSWGARLDLAGGLREGKMVMEGDSKAATGATTKNRITWSKEPEGRVRQLWETSSDDGKTWAVSFDGLYSPEAAAK